MSSNCKDLYPDFNDKGSNNNKANLIEDSIATIIQSLGETIERDGLRDTPKRACEALKFLTKGYSDDLTNIVNGALFDADSDQTIIVKGIEFYSLCEHHLLPFIGKCHVAYIPNNKVLGLSKIHRIVEMFSRRLQIQENLTKQIAESILFVTKAKGVSVIIESQHCCVMMRGIEKQHSAMVTFKTLGIFCDNSQIQRDFLNMALKS